MNERDFIKAVKLCDDLTRELDRLFVLTGDPHGEDAVRGADQLRRAVNAMASITASIHLARSAAWFDHQGEGGGNE